MARSAEKKAREPLSRERIEEAALELIEREGLAEFSTRKLASGLGCEAMSIYHYFPSKAHLMDALLDRRLADLASPPENLPWLERLRRFAWEYRRWAHAGPRFFQFALLHRMNTPGGLRVLNDVVAIFRDAGFDVEASARLFRVMGYYVAGAALDETSGYARGPSAVEPVDDATAAEAYPAITAVNPYFKPPEHEATFATGLGIMLDGIAREAASRGIGRPRKPRGRQAQGGGVRRRASP